MEVSGFKARGRKWDYVLYTALALMLVLWACVKLNAFGRNVHGQATCASGSTAVGVYMQAERWPRAWSNGPEIQSGQAQWRRGSQPNVAIFDYWLQFGGRLSVHLGCGGSQALWASDNYGGTNLVITCDDPAVPVAQVTTTTDGKCKLIP